MGTEYTLGVHGSCDTPQGKGVRLLAYEMSGLLDVYVDVPKDQVDIDAWEDAARVVLWNNVEPKDLLRMGLNFIKIACRNMSEEDRASNCLEDHAL
jgi:hypothetical protein